MEIKNYESELTDTKIAYFPHEITVLYRKDVETEILPYVTEKYGKDFILLYEDNKLNTVKCGRESCDNMIRVRGKSTNRKYCSKSCYLAIHTNGITNVGDRRHKIVNKKCIIENCQNNVSRWDNKKCLECITKMRIEKKSQIC